MHSVTLFTTLALVGLPLLAISQSIDPNSVPRPIRDVWCNNQKKSCPLLCSQLPGQSPTFRENECLPATLFYRCVCGNGMIPNASEYSETIPYYICSEANNQCVTACGSNNACARACREDRPCGAQNPTPLNTSTQSTMRATTTSAGRATGTAAGEDEIFTGFGGSPPTDAAANGNAGFVAVDIGRSYGLGAVAVGVFAGFAFVL